VARIGNKKKNIGIKTDSEKWQVAMNNYIIISKSNFLPITQRLFSLPVLFLAGTIIQGCAPDGRRAANDRPNLIIIFTDDMGYGDLGVYGHPTIKTPHLDQMACEGQKWTQFYVAASVCTPSRAGLLTGRLPVRSGMNHVLFPHSERGLPPDEITLARILKDHGYRTAMAGKWHLGHEAPYLPTDHGFETYLGIPYSNDMDRDDELFSGKNDIITAEEENFMVYNIPLMRNDSIVERPVDQRTITRRFTEEVVECIREFRDESFFIYLAHPMPHVPLFRSEIFKNNSLAGIYGDVIEEIDWSVGRILETLHEEGIAENTLVVFTSDNGPWSTYQIHGGSSGMLRGAKGTTYEGGMRVPAIFWWPGTIQSDVIMELGSTLDIFETFCSIAGIKMPSGQEYDGFDISPVLFGTGKSPRNTIEYYWGTRLIAYRYGRYKAHLAGREAWGDPVIRYEPPKLYDLNTDPGEKYNIASENPGVIDEIIQLIEEHKATIITKNQKQ
jgi:arylsulfatase A